MPSELHTERRNATLVLTISDPASRNTLSEQVFAAGVEALDVAESDPAIRCIVLRGEGSNFCAGTSPQQLKEGRHTPRDVQGQTLQRFHDFVEVLRVFPKPIIAAVEGAATGEGCALALACDLLIAASDAKFVPSHAQLGLSPNGGTSWQLVQRLPRSLALQWLWLSEPIAAKQLQEHGLVNWVTGSSEALAMALDVAERLALCAPNAIASTKELINNWPERSLGQQLDAEREHFLDNLMHANGAEGLASLIDKRPPSFS